VIKLDGFGWRHAGRRAWAVRGIDLRIERGERVLLLGPSGAGKSTLLHALAGLLPTDSGESEGSLTVDGRAGIVFQDPQSQLVMSRSGDEVAFGLENLGVSRERIWPRVAEVLAQVRFRYGLDRRTERLSGGEQQRLVLAATLAPHTDLLLLDEPTANLDPAGAAIVREVLRDAVGAHTTLVLIEHRLADVLPLVDRVVVLSREGIRADGPPSLLDGRLGDELAAEGVWVPGRPLDPLPAAHKGEPVLEANGVRARGLSFPDLSLREGEAVALTGPNGSGKSTFALVCGGLLKPEAGLVSTRQMGFVFQNPEHQFVTNSVRKELEVGGTRPERVAELLERLRLTHLEKANPFTLSGGEARRLSVATAIAKAPRLLILDEPTFGQDRRTWTELIELLAQLRGQGRGILAATHDPDVVAVLADRTVEL